MTRKLNVMMVGAHPADAFDAVGGTLAKHADAGDHVVAVVLTHGVKSHDWSLMAEERDKKASAGDAEVQRQITLKEKEVREGLAILGIEDAYFLNMDDQFLQIDRQVVWDLAGLIRKERPHILITQSPLEQNGVADQHALCGQIVLLAIRQASSVMPGHPLPPFGVSRVYFDAAGGKTTSLEYERNRFPHILIDIEETVERKVKAIDKLRSQFYNGDAGRKMTEVRQFIWGLHQRLPYVEGFQIFEPLVYGTLPVPEYDFVRAGIPYEEQYRHAGKLITPFVEEDE
jgi:4-oxalomesaconate hydratase